MPFCTFFNSFHSRIICAKCDCNWSCISWKCKLLNVVDVFSLFCNYLPFIWKKDLNPFNVRMICWNLLRFKELLNVIKLFRRYLFLEKDMILHFKETWIPFTKEVWLKLAQWFRRRFLNFHMYFHYFTFMRMTLHLDKLKPPSPKDDLCHVCLKFDQWFWRKRWKWEVYRQTDDRRSE